MRRNEFRLSCGLKVWWQPATVNPSIKNLGITNINGEVKYYLTPEAQEQLVKFIQDGKEEICERAQAPKMFIYDPATKEKKPIYAKSLNEEKTKGSALSEPYRSFFAKHCLEMFGIDIFKSTLPTNKDKPMIKFEIEGQEKEKVLKASLKIDTSYIGRTYLKLVINGVSIFGIDSEKGELILIKVDKELQARVPGLNFNEKLEIVTR